MLVVQETQRLLALMCLAQGLLEILKSENQVVALGKEERQQAGLSLFPF